VFIIIQDHSTPDDCRKDDDFFRRFCDYCCADDDN